jgi:hypothetical protein
MPNIKSRNTPRRTVLLNVKLVMTNTHKSPVQDLVDLVSQYKDVNINQLLIDAYNRGFREGYEGAKETIIEKVKEI